MTKVTIDEITYSVTVAEENINVTVADASETIQIQIASGASDIQIISTGETGSLISSTAGVVTTLKTISAGDNITLSDDGDTITISGQPEDDLSNNTTDDLAEGSNLYYTDDRVQAKLADVTGHILPSANITYDLGSPTLMWRDLYVGPGSLYVDGQKVVSSDEGTIDITTDAGQNMRIAPGGTLDLDSGNDITRFLDNSITLGTNNATVTVNGAVNADDVNLDDLQLSGTLFNQTGLNQNLEIRTNGGFLHANVTDLYVGPLTGAVKIDENSISTTDATQLTIEGFTNSADMTTAINTAESNANAYTDTREIAITSAYQTYADQAETDAITASNSYADTAIANLVDSAPATLDTLNELAAALGDDPNFATTVTNQIATKWTQDNTKISNWDTAYSWGNHADEGYLTSFTETDPTVPAHVKSITTTNISNWDTAYSWGDHSIVGYITDYTVTESDVTQHQAALQITESQITDLTHYTDTDARNAISLTSTNTAELSYDSATGVFSYVSPSTVTASNAVTLEVRNSSGVDIAKGDAVYISGHSGNKVLIAKADNDASGKYPAIGLAAGAMLNNSDGQVTVYGELAGVDTTSYAVGDVLYLGSTAGALTNVRPSGETNAVQNIGKVARSDSNGIIIVSGSGRSNDIPNLATGEVFIGADRRALTTDDVSEGTNLYYTDARVDARIPTNVSAFTNDAGYLTSYTETDPIYTASSWYTTTNNAANWDTAYSWGDHSVAGYLTSYTETDPVFTASAASGITSGDITNWNTAYGWGDHSTQGYLTSYTETDPIYTASSWYTTTNNSANWDTAYGWGDHSTQGYVNSGGAISAVENEATLDLTGQVTMSQDLDVSGLIKVNDGFTLGSFNPYAGFGGTTMNTSVMGVGQESGWAGMTVRSRGEHDWGLSGFGIPPEAPRALLALQSGRLDGGSDDYLNSGDRFGQMMFNPYSGYRTGVEWLTPSAIVEATATQDHWQGGTAGFGTKLRLWTTVDGDFGGSTDAQHAKSWIDIQGETITTSGTLKIDDDLQVTGSISNPNGDIIINDKVEINGSNAKETIIGDDTIAGVFDIHGIKVKADDTAWGSILIQEYEGGANKPAGTGFLNPSFGTEIIGGTPSSPSNVSSGKRLFVLQSLAANQTDGTLPQTANFRIKAETTETQTSTNRGTKVSIETMPNGGAATTETLSLQDNEVTINPSGNGIIRAGSDLRLGSALDTFNNNIINSLGDVTVNDNLKVNNDLTVDGTATFNGNVNLGNANTDSIQATGYLKANNGFGLTVLNTATANYLSGVLGIISTGDVAYISDGDSGSPCIGVYTGSAWKRIALGSDISSS